MTAAGKKRGRTPWRVVLLTLGLLALVVIDMREQLRAPLNIAAATSFELPAGSRLDGNLARLEKLGLFASTRQRFYLSAYARMRDATTSIKAGEYALEPGLTPRGLLALWTSGRTVLHALRLIEGWRFAQALAAIRQSRELTHTLGEADAEAVMRALALPGVAAEGRFFPDTYRFPKGTSDVAFLKDANAALETTLQTEWAQRAQNLPYDTPDQALVMASIIEKESGRSSEREQIAGVFVRRLRLGMRLQTDPTVIYGLGDDYDGNIRSRDLVRDTPYNTYTRDGLPPTPICLVGREAIHAALHPDDGKALYFVARGDGGHQFSETLAEHNTAVRRYQPKAGAGR